MDLLKYRKIGGYRKTSKVSLDDTLKSLASMSDYSFSGESSFDVPTFDVPSEFTLGVIYGSSGTGKSTLLEEFGSIQDFQWDSSKAIASQVDHQLLMQLGLSSIPSLCRPYHALSTGEKHRADIAVSLKNGCVIDEFTSVCNRALAKSISIGLRKTIDKQGYKNIVIASCHEDVLDWLEPDWTINTITGALVEGRSKRQKSEYRLTSCSVKAWPIFKDHHYLGGDINKGAYCWMLLDKDAPCGFSSAICNPARGLTNAWREHRTVVLPDYQGLGLGSKLSNTVAQIFKDAGYRYFSKTAHPKLGEHRNNSNLWKPTATNLVNREKHYLQFAQRNIYKSSMTLYTRHATRLCYSHEYIGEDGIINKVNTSSVQYGLFDERNKNDTAQR